MKHTSQKRNKGFTLVELMVAVSIFAIIMVMSMGAVVSILEANRKSRTLKSAMNNLNLVVESIARNVKFGTNWNLTGGTDCVGSGISFIDKFSIPNVTRNVSYCYVAVPGAGRIDRKIDIVGGATGSFESLTSPEINIKRFSLTGSGLLSNDNQQPFLILSIGGVAGSRASNQTSFDLQTAVSQRELQE